MLVVFVVFDQAFSRLLLEVQQLILRLLLKAIWKLKLTEMYGLLLLPLSMMSHRFPIFTHCR